MLWLNYPNNPTGATAPLEFYERGRRAGARARLRAGLRRGLLGALLRRRRRPSPRCRCADRTQRARRSTRSPSARRCPATAPGFVAGDPELIAALKRYRPERRRRAAGVRPARGGRRLERRGARRRGARALPRQARRRCCPRSRRSACATRAATRRSSSGSTPARTPTRCAAALLEQGVVVAPGSFFGAAGEGYLRLALVPTLEECERAAEIVSRWRAGRR